MRDAPRPDPLPRDGQLSFSLRAGMILAALLTPFGSTSIAVALPGIGHEFAAGRPELNLWLVVSYLLVAIAGQGPGGRLGDRITHERALLAGLGLHAFGALLGLSAEGLAGLAAARILAAAGGAIVVPAAMALVRTGVAGERRARAFGLLGGALGLAAAVGPPAGARLVEAFGWRSLFAFNLPFIAVAALLIARPAWRARRLERAGTGAHRTDLVGTFLLAAGLAPIVVAVTPSSGHGAAAIGFGAGAFAAVAAGAVLLGLFVAWERRTAQPVFDFDLFRRPAFSAGSAVIALQNLAMYGILFLLPASAAAAATKAAGSRAGGSEMLLFAMLGGLVVGPPIGGRLVEREGARMTALCGSFMTIVGLLMARGLGTAGAVPEALAGLFLVGLGLGIASAPAQASAMDAAAAGHAGTAAGTLSTMRYLGGLAGIAIINAVPGAPAQQHAWLAATGTAALLSLRLPGRAA